MDTAWTDAALSLGVGLGLAAAVGLRVFLPMLLLGLGARFGWITVAQDFQWVASGAAISAFGAATVIEIAAYYIPWLDNALDAAAGPCAIAAGILTTAALVADLPPPLRWGAAIVAGGGTAGMVQALTTAARLKSSVFTAGLGNPVLATLEWIGALIVSVLVIAVPAIAFALAAALVFAAYRIGRRFIARPAAPIRP